MFEIDKTYETAISSLIESQFPEAIRDVMGPVFVEFVKLYYQWLETEGQALYHSRRLMSYKDIDTTTEQFLVYFKEKYLKNIQLETNSNVKFLIKNSLDIYRSRGTPRSVDLLFRLVFGVGAEIYYPSSDIFRLSDGHWVRPTYLEITLSQDAEKFVGKEIIGVTSNAKAFVEKLIRRKTQSQYNDILYISSLIGNFQTGEKINAFVSPFRLEECPTIIGSLTSLIVRDGGDGFEVGDIVDVSSLHGVSGKARVASVINPTGTVDFNIDNGGYGYVAGTPLLVSNTILSLTNVTVNTSINNTHGYFDAFETVYQPMGSIIYINGTGTFTPNTFIYTYYANNSLKGSGLIINSSVTNSTSGFLTVAVRSGDLSDNTIYSTGNLVSANLAVAGGGYTDITASGKVFSQSSGANLHVTSVIGAFLPGEEIYQGNTTVTTANAIVATSNIVLGNGTIAIQNNINNLIPGQLVKGRSSGAEANLVSLDLNIGLISVNGTFSTDSRACLTNCVSGTTASIMRFSTGTGASANVGLIDVTETVNIDTDFIIDQLTINLDSTYGFTALPNANLASNISDSLTINTFTIGRIATLDNIHIGNNYNLAPMVRCVQDYIYPYTKKGWRIDIQVTNGNFQPNEIVTQEATGARGFIRSITNTFSQMSLSRASLLKEFVVTTNATTVLVGSSSGATANITYVDVENPNRVLNLNGEYIGFNANLFSNTKNGNGSIATLDVTDSGFGFQAGENVDVRSEDGLHIGTATAILERQGTGSGFYTELGGRLSSEKKLFDGFYYQDFSYEVRSSITLNKYKDMLLNVLHVAGTLPFGALYKRTIANAGIHIINSPVRQSFGSSGSANVVGVGESTAAAVGTIVAGALLIGANAALAPAVAKPDGAAAGSSNVYANGIMILAAIGVSHGGLANGVSGVGARTAAVTGTANGRTSQAVATGKTIVANTPANTVVTGYNGFADNFQRADSTGGAFDVFLTADYGDPTGGFWSFAGGLPHGDISSGQFVLTGSGINYNYLNGPCRYIGVHMVSGSATIRCMIDDKNYVQLIASPTSASVSYVQNGVAKSLNGGAAGNTSISFSSSGSHVCEMYIGGSDGPGTESIKLILGGKTTVMFGLPTAVIGKIVDVSGSGTMESIWGGSGGFTPSVVLNVPPNFWTITGSNWTLDSTNIKAIKTAGSAGTIQNEPWVPYPGTVYFLEYTLSNVTGGSFQFGIGGALGASRTSSGIYSEYITTNDNGKLKLIADSAAAGTISDIMVRRVYR